MADTRIARDLEGERTVLRIGGTFDREVAWALRDLVAREAGEELVLDFSLVRDFSDLGLAVLASALQGSARRVLFRGLRQHQVRIFRYCGLAVEERGAREAATPTAAALGA
jgi:anti-anti-sigma regulatory factor